MPNQTKLFVSHAHKDSDIAEKLVHALELAMSVPNGAIRCTSVPGYKLDLGSMAPEVLRQELATAECVIAILTPFSLASQWVLFELGAIWSQTKQAIPLLGGGLRDEDIPGPFRGAAGGSLQEMAALDQFLEQVMKELRWEERNRQAARKILGELVDIASKKVFYEEDVEREIKSNFAAKMAKIGINQSRIVNYIVNNINRRQYIKQEELCEKFKDVETGFYYRLEHLRLLGFLNKQEIGKRGNYPEYGWMLSKKYEAEIK